MQLNTTKKGFANHYILGFFRVLHNITTLLEMGLCKEKYKYLFPPCISLLIFLCFPSCLLSFSPHHLYIISCMHLSFLPSLLSSFLSLTSSVFTIYYIFRLQRDCICLSSILFSRLFVFAGTLPSMISEVPWWDHHQKPPPMFTWCGLTLGMSALPNGLDYWAGAWAKTSCPGSNPELKGPGSS